MNNSFKLTMLLIFILAGSAKLYGQAEKKYIRQGNNEFSKSKYAESEVLYRKAIVKNTVPDAQFNLGDALYKQDKFEDAGKSFIENANKVDDRAKKSNSYYNLGNSLLNSKKIEESIDAYKNSLKLNPGNMEAKYNLAYAQDLLKQEQEQQQQQGQQQNQKKDQESQDKQDQNQKQDQDKNKDQQNQQQKGNQQQNQQQQGDQQQSQQQQTGVTKEDAQRLLDALANDEKKVQEKVKEAKAASQKVRVLINW
jgi:Ca-activated chloride channel homolog